MQTIKKSGAGQDFPESWKPDKEGESINGTIVRRDVGRLIELDTGNGIRTVWTNKLLDEALNELKVAVGTMVEIKWLGKQKTKDGKRSYHTWEVSA